MENEQEKPIENGEKSALQDPITGKFVKGNPGGGRPAGTKSFTTKVKEALEKIAEGKDYTYEEAFIKSILKKGIVDGDSQIIRLIWNYLDGMPMQRTDITTDGKPILMPSDILTKYDTSRSPEDNSQGQS